jgi:dTDP-4-dehydrorhamnose reductase
VVYAHAVCNVNKCENNSEWAWKVNVENFRRFLTHIPWTQRLVYLSSDHVFGHGGLCDELTTPKPISFYGRTRIAAEQLALARPNSMVIRTSLALGDSHDGRSGHWNWLNHRLGNDLPVTIITDEARTTVWAPEAAMRIMKLAESHANGMVHLSNGFYTSRQQLALELCEIGKLDANLNYDQRANQTYPHLGQVQLVSRRHEGRLLINPLKQLALHIQSQCSIL